MNKGTDRNILTQLGMTTDQYNLVTVLYYVCIMIGWHSSRAMLTALDSIYCCGNPVKFVIQTNISFQVAVSDHGKRLSSIATWY